MFTIAINHKTKFIESWNIGLKNNNYLVLKHFKNINLKNKIIHSDHGAQYYSKEFSILIKKAGVKISMPCIGNSLDNHKAKYFFSNTKSEYLSHIQTKEITINKVKSKVREYIKWYNYNWIHSKLNWKTPTLARV